MTDSDFVFEQGSPIVVGTHGETDYLFHSGDPVPNTGGPGFVFESGTRLGPISGLIDDFEDANLTPVNPDWSDWDTPNGSISFEQNAPIAGTASARLSVSNGGLSTIETTGPDINITGMSYRIKPQDTTGEDDDAYWCVLKLPGGIQNATPVLFDHTGTIRKFSDIGDGTGKRQLGSWQTGTVYNVEYSNIDTSAETFDVLIETAGGTTVVSETGVSSRPGTQSTTEITARNDTDSIGGGADTTALFDNIRITLG